MVPRCTETDRRQNNDSSFTVHSEGLKLVDRTLKWSKTKTLKGIKSLGDFVLCVDGKKDESQSVQTIVSGVFRGFVGC